MYKVPMNGSGRAQPTVFFDMNRSSSLPFPFTQYPYGQFPAQSFQSFPPTVPIHADPRKERSKKHRKKKKSRRQEGDKSSFHTSSTIGATISQQQFGLPSGFQMSSQFAHPYGVEQSSRTMMKQAPFCPESPSVFLAKSDSMKPRKAKRKCQSASSKFKGVSWHKRDRCYMARVWVDGSSKHVGSFQQEMRAALAVDHTLIAMGKDESHLNFPVQLERDIAASILKHQTVSQDAGVLSSDGGLIEEELAKKGLDRNGFPNGIERVLSGLLVEMSQRRSKLESGSSRSKQRSPDVKEPAVEPKNAESSLPVKEQTVEKTSKNIPRWNTLLEVATNQHNLQNFQKDVSTTSDNAPTGDQSS